MVDIPKGGGRAPPTLTRLGCSFHQDGMYAIAILCVLCEVYCNVKCEYTWCFGATLHKYITLYFVHKYMYLIVLLTLLTIYLFASDFYLAVCPAACILSRVCNLACSLVIYF
jgi:hypothetical protein